MTKTELINTIEKLVEEMIEEKYQRDRNDLATSIRVFIRKLREETYKAR